MYVYRQAGHYARLTPRTKCDLLVERPLAQPLGQRALLGHLSPVLRPDQVTRDAPELVPSRLFLALGELPPGLPDLVLSLARHARIDPVQGHLMPDGLV